MRQRSLTFLAALALLLVSAVPDPALAQDKKQGKKADKPQFGELIEVTEVFLDVLATDKKGNIVHGLGKEDFVVLEEGEEMPITSVDFYTTRYNDESSPVDAVSAEELTGETAGDFTEVPASRYFILFFEDQKRNNTASNRLLRQQMDAGRRAHDWVRDGLQGSDWVAVLSYDVKLEIHQDFTQSVPDLIAGIAAATTGKKRDEPLRSERQREIAQAPLSLLANLPDGNALRDETVTIYDALRLVGEATRPIVGRKNVLLFTIGFGDFRGNYTEPDERYYPQMERALNDNNVAVYPIDLFPPGTRHPQSNFLNQLATDTGGEYFFNFVNFITPLQEIAEETTGYYLLSYRSEHPAGETGYRTVEVKAKEKKVQVRARRGYEFGIGE